MTPSELKFILQDKDDSHFFDRANMKFAGDTMRNYGIRSTTIKTLYVNGVYVGDKDGVSVEVWELYRKNPVKCGLQSSAYFDKTTFNQTFKV